MYVVSHHCSDYNAVKLDKFISICKKYKIPTIIDAASEEYMENFINIQNKQAMQKTLDEKKIQKK